MRRLFTGFSDPPLRNHHLTLAGIIELLANISHEISPNTSIPGTKGELERGAPRGLSAPMFFILEKYEEYTSSLCKRLLVKISRTAFDCN